MRTVRSQFALSVTPPAEQYEELMAELAAITIEDTDHPRFVVDTLGAREGQFFLHVNLAEADMKDDRFGKGNFATWKNFVREKAGPEATVSPVAL